MNRILLLLLITISTVSFSQENLFKTSKTAVVLKNDPLNIDDSNSLIIIPSGRMFRKYFEKINYFKEVIDYGVFEKEVKNANINQEEFKNAKVIDDAFKVIYKVHRKFLTFTMVTDKETKTIKFILNKPDYGDIFIVEGKSKTNVVGISAGTTYVPEDVYDAMMNELVNYIKSNSKTYYK